LVAASVCLDDLLIASPEEGTSDPGGIGTAVVFGGGDDGGNVAGFLMRKVLMLLAKIPGRSSRKVKKTIVND
jgi:hypothetical protein